MSKTVRVQPQLANIPPDSVGQNGFYNSVIGDTLADVGEASVPAEPPACGDEIRPDDQSFPERWGPVTAVASLFWSNYDSFVHLHFLYFRAHVRELLVGLF